MNDPQAGQSRLAGGVHGKEAVQRIGAHHIDGLFGQLDADLAQRFQITGQVRVPGQGMGPNLHLDPSLFIRPAQRAVGRGDDQRGDGAVLVKKSGDFQQLLGGAFPVQVVGEQGGAQWAAGFTSQAARGNDETGIFPGQVGVEIRIDHRVKALAIGGDFLRSVAKPPGLPFVVQQFGVGGIDDTIAAFAQPIAIIGIVIGHWEALLVEPAKLQKQRTGRQQTGGRHRSAVAGHGDVGQVAVIAAPGQFKGVVAQAVDAMYNPGMLNLAVLVTQQCAHRADARQLGMTDHAG